VSRSLGIDYGTKRVGLALSDTLGLTANPLAVVPRSSIVDEVIRLVKEQDVGTIVVGLPTGLGGDEGISASEARELADELAMATGDQRLAWTVPPTTSGSNVPRSAKAPEKSPNSGFSRMVRYAVAPRCLRILPPSLIKLSNGLKPPRSPSCQRRK